MEEDFTRKIIAFLGSDVTVSLTTLLVIIAGIGSAISAEKFNYLKKRIPRPRYKEINKSFVVSDRWLLAFLCASGALMIEMFIRLYLLSE